MKPEFHYPHRRDAAFTLIEMLVVIGVILVLAGLILPVAGPMRIRAAKSRAQTELAQVETAIDSYKAKLGFYPPDHPGNPALNQLYYELAGTVLNNNGTTYQPLDGSPPILTNVVASALGVGGFMNCATGGGGDEAPVAANFLKGLNRAQIKQLSNGAKILVVSVDWPTDLAAYPAPIAGQPGVNPIQYVSSNPTHNPASYDLWADLLLGGKVYRISNWSSTPEVVGSY